jgi:hypothetical protein
MRGGWRAAGTARRREEPTRLLTRGIDVAKGTLEVAIWRDGQNGQGARLGTFAKTPAGWARRGSSPRSR